MWFTPALRAAIAEAVTPLEPGQGVLHSELQRRFVRAVTYINALDDLFVRGQVPTLADVAALAAVVL